MQTAARRADARAFSNRRCSDEIAVPRLAPGRQRMENAAARMVRGKDPIRHHVRRKICHCVMVNPAPHTKFRIVPREIADGHVLDHATAQRADLGHLKTSCLRVGCDTQILSDKRPFARPRRSRRGSGFVQSPFRLQSKIRPHGLEPSLFRHGLSMRLDDAPRG